ncbi:MAG TPA: carbohydrate ABC transporter permease [Holophagaceae bacterium]|nr:carbohydrate ABC transporter permease [Holophagaceae bacterium]
MRRWIRGALLAAAVAAVAVYALLPVVWAAGTSLKAGSAIFDPALFPAHPAWSNYAAVFREQPFGRNILNSLLAAGATTVASLLLGLLAAYALGRHRFRGRQAVLYTFLGASMFPQIALLSGLFELIRSLGLYDRWEGLALSYLIFTLPFTVWVLTAFLRELPPSLDEAARLDGAGPLTILFRVLLPALGPTLAATGLLAFIAAWNEFLFALTFTLSDAGRTVPVALAQMSGSSQFELPWGRLMAASLVVTAPTVVLALAFQRRIVAGLTAGSVKG